MSNIIEPVVDATIKKKRGRKKKSDILTEEMNADNSTENNEPVLPKKRGRKPKGGKIITKLSKY